MKVLLESTTKITRLVGDFGAVEARIWEGHTESGIPVHAYITLIAAPTMAPEQMGQFERELEQRCAPSAEIEAIPLRLLI